MKHSGNDHVNYVTYLICRNL